MNDITPPSDSCAINGCTKTPFSRGWCSTHYSRWHRNGDPLATKRHSPQDPNAAERWCPRCHLYVATSEFGLRTGGRPKGYCRQCEATYDMEYRATSNGANRKRAASRRWTTGNREYFLMRNYRLTLDGYSDLLAAQSGVCAICGTDQPGGGNDYLAVDHCHDSKVVRGLLCVHCNLAIGQMSDDPARLRAAADYLDRFK